MRDPRQWFRSTSDRDLRGYVGVALFSVALGVVWMTVVLPLVDRSSLAGLPWTVIWSAVAVLAWRERRRRAGAGSRRGVSPPRR